MNAAVASDYGAMKKTLKLNRFLDKLWDSRHIKCMSTMRWSWNQAYTTIGWDTASWCAKNSGEKCYFNCFYLRSLTAKGLIQISIRLEAEVE